MRSAMMVRALHAISRAVHQWTVVYPLKQGEVIPPHDFALDVPANAAPGLTVMRALEENMGAVATLMPEHEVAVVSIPQLRTLLAIAKNVHPAWSITEKQLHEEGIATLDGWSRMREHENREREGS